jgi:hypothetical protein
LRRSKLADVVLLDAPPRQSESNAKLSRCHVRFVSLVGILGGLRDVRFTPESEN